MRNQNQKQKAITKRQTGKKTSVKVTEPLVADATQKKLAKFQELLGYQFKNTELLRQALTHRSAVRETSQLTVEMLASQVWNERLEFLGDSVLGLCISQKLMSEAKESSEGELSRMRAALVNEESLAQIARSIDLGKFVFLGRGERLSGGQKRAALLADTLEAIFGAIFLDADLETAAVVIYRLFHNKFGRNLTKLVQTDFKTLLQEMTQDQLRVTPTYRVCGETGPDHEKMFEVAVYLRGKEYGRGFGSNKKRASQAAAKQALILMKAGEASTTVAEKISVTVPSDQPKTVDIED